MLPILKQFQEIFRGSKADEEVDDEVDDEVDEVDDETDEQPDTTQICLN